jgi:RNA polymerase sigma factor (sigma-70 family)
MLRALQHRLLTPAQERLLGHRAQRGDSDARNQLVCANLRLVRSIARGHSGKGVPFADLFQQGIVGLVRAAEKYDPNKGVRFPTYATWWIRQAVGALLYDDRPIRLPRHRAHEIAAARALTNGNGHDAGHALAAVVAPLRLDHGEHGRGQFDKIADRATAHDMELVELRVSVTRLLAALTSQQRAVMRLRFGLDGFDHRTYDEVGALMGLSRETVRKLARQAIERLRELTTDGVPFPV